MGPPLLAPGIALPRRRRSGSRRRSSSANGESVSARRRGASRPARPAEAAQRGTTPQMVGRYPRHDVLASGRPLGRADARGRPRPRARTCRRSASSTRPRRHAEGVLRRRHGAGRASRASRCSPTSTRSCRRGSATAGGSTTCRTTASSGACVARGLDEEARARRLRELRDAPLEARRSRSSTASRRRSFAAASWEHDQRRARLLAWSCATSRRRSTRTRGRGTRSASAARPTRAATRAFGSPAPRRAGGLGGDGERRTTTR